MPRPKTEISKEDRDKVEKMAGLGLRDDQICTIMGFSESTLKRRCRPSLNKGRARASLAIANKTYEMAMQGDKTMLIWWEKTRMGMREQQEHKVVRTSDDGKIKVEVELVKL